MRNFISVLKLVLFSAALAVGTALAAGMPAIVHKPSVEARQAPDFSAPVVATLRRNAQVEISGQQGLWYELALPEGGSAGYASTRSAWLTRARKHPMPTAARCCRVRPDAAASLRPPPCAASRSEEHTSE